MVLGSNAYIPTTEVQGDLQPTTCVFRQPCCHHVVNPLGHHRISFGPSPNTVLQEWIVKVKSGSLHKMKKNTNCYNGLGMPNDIRHIIDKIQKTTSIKHCMTKDWPGKGDMKLHEVIHAVEKNEQFPAQT